jgi:hypothetical protein
MQSGAHRKFGPVRSIIPIIFRAAPDNVIGGQGDGDRGCEAGSKRRLERVSLDAHKSTLLLWLLWFQFSNTPLSILLTFEQIRRKREMDIREHHHKEADPTTALYQAAVAGSVPSFKNLIQKDPLILNKVSLTHFSDTPLHTSALLGHIEFTKALLTHNSRLAQVRDSLRRPPLLLASAEGHKETVQALLKAYPDACLFRDQDGRIPLHYAAMRGHTEVLADLMRAKPESVSLRVLDRGDTVFHLCVIYNQIECLKLLVEEVGDNGDFLNARAGSDGGMTILELAVMLRQIQVYISLSCFRFLLFKEIQFSFSFMIR